MVFIFQVVDIQKQCSIGFVTDALLNLSHNPRKAKQLESSSSKDLQKQVNEYQKRLDMILNGDVEPDSAIVGIRDYLYGKYYRDYKVGQLKIVPKVYQAFF